MAHPIAHLFARLSRRIVSTLGHPRALDPQSTRKLKMFESRGRTTFATVVRDECPQLYYMLPHVQQVIQYAFGLRAATPIDMTAVGLDVAAARPAHFNSIHPRGRQHCSGCCEVPVWNLAVRKLKAQNRMARSTSQDTQRGTALPQQLQPHRLR